MYGRRRERIGRKVYAAVDARGPIGKGGAVAVAINLGETSGREVKILIQRIGDIVANAGAETPEHPWPSCQQRVGMNAGTARRFRIEARQRFEPRERRKIIRRGFVIMGKP